MQALLGVAAVEGLQAARQAGGICLQRLLTDGFSRAFHAAQCLKAQVVLAARDEEALLHCLAAFPIGAGNLLRRIHRPPGREEYAAHWLGIPAGKLLKAAHAGAPLEQDHQLPLLPEEFQTGAFSGIAAQHLRNPRLAQRGGGRAGLNQHDLIAVSIQMQIRQNLAAEQLWRDAAGYQIPQHLRLKSLPQHAAVDAVGFRGIPAWNWKF